MGLMEVVFRCVSVFVDKQHIHKLSVLSDGKGIKITNFVCTGKNRDWQTHTNTHNLGLPLESQSLHSLLIRHLFTHHTFDALL